MEASGVAQETSWSSYNATGEESEVMLHLLGPYNHSNEQGDEIPNYGLSWSSEHASDSYYCSTENAPNASNLFCWSQGDDSSNSSFIAPSAGFENYYLNLNEAYGASETNANATTMNYFMVGDQFTDHSSLRLIPNPSFGDPNEDNSGDELDNSNLNVSQHSDQPMQPKRKCKASEDGNPLESTKKRTRGGSATVQKNAKKMQSKRSYKRSKSTVDEDEMNAVNNGQSSCSYSSEDDSPASQDNNGGGSPTCSSKGNSSALNLSGKLRAGRGSATDPQSLYARKRRERINERLRILQNLVPNGTKVDISTMLEEAVQYVKFLQLQIKLLSSDDLWMYAPIAYNGMNIGLDLKIALPQQ